MSQQTRYTAVAMFLHWLTAIVILALLVVGNIMADMHDPAEQELRQSLYQWHKSFGIALLLVTLFRLAWRLNHTPPPLPDSMKAVEVKAAHAAHWLLYGLLLLTPMLGWVVASTTPRHVPTFLFGLVQLPDLPYFADMDTAVRKANKDLFEGLHASVAYIMAGLVVLHVGAALRHRLILKDQVVQRMLPKFIPLLLLAALASPPAAAADWQVDSARSSLGFTGVLSGAAFQGKFKSWQAEIAFDPANPAAGHAKVTIDMASAVTGDRQRDAALPNEDWFDVRKMPQALFEAGSFAAKGGNAYEAQGALTIRGVTRPVTLPFTLEIGPDGAHAKGQLDIVRTDYGVGQGEWSDGGTVALKVSILFDLTARARG